MSHTHTHNVKLSNYFLYYLRSNGYAVQIKSQRNAIYFAGTMYAMYTILTHRQDKHVRKFIFNKCISEHV